MGHDVCVAVAAERNLLARASPGGILIPKREGEEESTSYDQHQKQPDLYP
jgi:hypothetical protein